MSGVTALKKINARTKQLHKKHPGKKYSTLRKQAAKEYNAGTIPKARKKKAKVGKRKYKVTHRVKRVGTVNVSPKRKPRRKAAKRRKHVATKTRRRVGSSGGSGLKKIMPLLLVGGLGILAYMAFKKPSIPVLPVALTPTSNAARTAAATNILQYATAAGATITALTALVNALNSSSDDSVIAASNQVTAGGGLPPDISGGGAPQPWIA